MNDIYIITLKNKKNNKLSCRMFGSRKRAVKYAARIKSKRDHKKLIKVINRFDVNDRKLFEQHLWYDQSEEAFYFVDKDFAQRFFN